MKKRTPWISANFCRELVYRPPKNMIAEVPLEGGHWRNPGFCERMKRPWAPATGQMPTGKRTQCRDTVIQYCSLYGKATNPLQVVAPTGADTHVP